MRRKLGWRRAMVGLTGVLFTAVLLGWGQFGSATGDAGLQRSLDRQQSPLNEAPEPDAAWNQKRIRALNADRHKSMVSDTEKLLKLARQFDAEIASNPRDELTPEELKKLAEIEKLARSVKSKMVLSFTGGPQLRGPIFSSDPLDGPGVR